MKKYTLLSIIAAVLTGKTLADCFSVELGYPCCKKNFKVVYTDKDGQWGVEDKHWCGLPALTEYNDCWSMKLGYPCCKKNTKIIVSDKDGDWSVEDKHWCGIIKPSNTTTQDQQQPTSVNMAEIAKTYMEKMNIENPIPTDITSEVEGVIVEKKSYESKTTGTTRQMNIILPLNYSKDKKYPVLYLLHGIFGNEDSMLKSTMGSLTIPANLAKQEKAKEIILVLPNQYAPAPENVIPDELLENMNQEIFEAYSEGYDNFINDLVNDIMPYMEKNYPIETGRDNTGIAGFSMGGRNALYIGYERPDLFGYVAGFSPAPGVTPGVDMNGIHKGLFQESEFRIKDPAKYTPYVTLISGGTNDTVVGTFPESYHNILTENNQPHVWIEIPGGEHNGKASVVGFYNFLTAAFGALN